MNGSLQEKIGMYPRGKTTNTLNDQYFIYISSKLELIFKKNRDVNPNEFWPKMLIYCFAAKFYLLR